MLAYCLMCNHFHLLLEVPPMPAGGLSDEELLGRLRAIYSEAVVAEVAKELAEARQKVRDGLAEESVVVARIHERFTYRMHDLGEFMKTLLQRFTQWFNRTHAAHREPVGGRVQERDRGGRRGGEDDGGLHRPEPGEGGDGEGSGGLPVEQLWRGDGRRAERQWQEGAGGLGAGVGGAPGLWRRTRGSGRRMFRGNTG